MNVSNYKDALLKKRTELEETAGLKPLTDSMEHNNGRQGDMADQAAGNNEVHIQLRLKQTDAKILQAIDEALMRIEKGTFGICRTAASRSPKPGSTPFPGRGSASPARKSRKRERPGPGGSDPRLSISSAWHC